MDFHVSAENAHFLRLQVETGVFVNENAALEAAIELLKRTAALRAQIDRGVNQLESGDFVELNESSLGTYFDQILSIASCAGQ